MMSKADNTEGEDDTHSALGVLVLHQLLARFNALEIQIFAWSTHTFGHL